MILIFKRLPKPEAFEGVRVCMLSKWLLDGADGSTVIAFTSRSRGEGVSTVVAGLARSFGAADPGSVLVLDAAPGRWRIRDLLQVQATEASLSNFEAGSLDLLSCVAHDEKHGIDILTLSDAGPTKPGSALRARSIVDGLRSNYRVILLDAGALSKGWASSWLASSNYRVLVIDTSTATQEVLKHERKELEHSGIKLDGSILNKRTYLIPSALYWLVR